MTKLGTLLKERQEEIIRGIQECVRIDSVKSEPKEGAPYGEGPRKALDYALELGKTLGMRTKNVDNRAGWVEIGEGEEMVAVLGHLDVVPLGEGWNHPGFGAVIEDGVLYGRGVMDDKGPTIGAIYGVKAIEDAGIPLNRRIRVIFGTDEECGSSCIQHYVDAGEEIPVMGFTPDGEYPLIFCEKGMMTLWAGREQPVEGEKKILAFQGGTMSNIVTQKCLLQVEGELEVSDVEGVTVSRENGTTLIQAEGKSSHGSKPQLGINAAIRLLQAVKGNSFGGDFQKLLDFLLTEIGTETTGEKMGIRYVDEETGETTVNVGVLEYTPEKMQVTLDIRYPKNGSHEAIYGKVEELLAGYGLQILRHTTEKMLYMPKDSELVKTLMQVYRDVTGRDDKPVAIGGGTYAKMFPNMVAFGPTFPGKPDTIHQANECAFLESLMTGIRITTEAIAALAVK